jgi:hypothetical protein
VEGVHVALLLVGYAAGAMFYGAVAYALWRGLRTGAAALLAFYWCRRSRREAVATIRRVKAAQSPPQRRAA